MRLIYLIPGLLLFIPTIANSQIDYDRIKQKKLLPILIDTINDPVIVIKKRYSTVYFKQADIIEYLRPFNVSGVRIDIHHESVKKLLSANVKYIRMIDWWHSYTEIERNQLSKLETFSNEDHKFLEEFYYTGADLIHDGKFMIIDNQSKKVIIKGLKIKKIHGLYGTEYIEFFHPHKKSFWYIVTRRENNELARSTSPKILGLKFNPRKRF
jgi:hypothetical protein